MENQFEDVLTNWNKTSSALRHAFFYNNHLPIEEISNQFGTVWSDLRDLYMLTKKAQRESLSVSEQKRFDATLRKTPIARLQKLIDDLVNLRLKCREPEHP